MEKHLIIFLEPNQAEIQVWDGDDTVPDFEHKHITQ